MNIYLRVSIDHYYKLAMLHYGYLDFWKMQFDNFFSITRTKMLLILLCQKPASCNTGSIRDGPSWTPSENSLELIELSSINKFSLVYVSSCSNTGSIRDAGVDPARFF